MLQRSRLPSSDWCYAFSTTTYLINRVPSTILQFQSPWEKLFHSPPSLQSLKTFGRACSPFLRPYTNHKLQPKSTQCIFLGYPPLTKGYIYFDPHTQKIYITSHVSFHESDFPGLPATLPSSSITSDVSCPSFDLWLSTLLPSSSFNSLSIVSAVFPPLQPSVVVSNVPSNALSDVSSLVTSPSPVTIAPTKPMPQSSLPPTQSVSTSNPNTHPMPTRSKHGIFKPKA